MAIVIFFLVNREVDHKTRYIVSGIHILEIFAVFGEVSRGGETYLLRRGASDLLVGFRPRGVFWGLRELFSTHKARSAGGLWTDRESPMYPSTCTAHSPL